MGEQPQPLNIMSMIMCCMNRYDLLVTTGWLGLEGEPGIGTGSMAGVMTGVKMVYGVGSWTRKQKSKHA